MQLSAGDITVLSHCPTPAIAHGRHQWWRAWRKRVDELDPILRDPTPDERHAGVTHLITSLNDVRVGARLILPEGAPRGGIVQLHGYGAREDLDDRSPYARAGLAVLKLRVRGFPGSTLDTGDLCSAPGGWIAQGLHDPDRSALIAAAADVVVAACALCARLGGQPVSLRGDSLGGGLAVIAAAQAPEGVIDRIAIAMPSLGDWTGRLLNHTSAGAGGEAARALEDAGEKQGELRRTLRLADAVLHARRVHQPAICLLAINDDTVPPESAAAIYNALASDPGLKKRVLIERGHTEPSRDDARRLVDFEKRAVRFLDPDISAIGALI